jgi:hypothetical protein
MSHAGELLMDEKSGGYQKRPSSEEKGLLIGLLSSWKFDYFFLI